MGDHFALLVDRLLTESTLEATIGRTRESDFLEGGGTSPLERCPTGGKIVQCKICHDEDQDSNMEVPCSCSGSLKYAHRKCIQRWCNEKGDTMCEICLQQFRPGYTAPHKLFHYGSSPMDFRGNWEVSRQELDGSHIIAMVPSDRVHTGGYDDYGSSSTRNILYCRSVAIIFTLLLILRHILPILVGGDEFSFTTFGLSVLRIGGILVPVYVMVRALSSFQRRRRQQLVISIFQSSTHDSTYPSLWGLLHLLSIRNITAILVQVPE